MASVSEQIKCPLVVSYVRDIKFAAVSSFVCCNVQAKSCSQRVSIIIVSEGAVDQAGQIITANQVKEVILSKLIHSTHYTMVHAIYVAHVI